jgi:uncharacterized protein YbjT (DUF2867 family)
MAPGSTRRARDFGIAAHRRCIEEHLRGTGMHYTIVRPVFFMENWLAMRQMIEDGSIALGAIVSGRVIVATAKFTF